jgi:hypothetical protein
LPPSRLDRRRTDLKCPHEDRPKGRDVGEEREEGGNGSEVLVALYSVVCPLGERVCRGGEVEFGDEVAERRRGKNGGAEKWIKEVLGGDDLR